MRLFLTVLLSFLLAETIIAQLQDANSLKKQLQEASKDSIQYDKSMELLKIDKMEAEIGKGDLEEAKTIANDIKQNLEKINYHGKRADAIVKGMLQHSRSSSGIKEPTDINKLADEYLCLAYHGLRAKDKSFNATMKTHYDETIGTINIIPQDMGKVILNLITNAFYVVNEKKKSGIDNYEPTVAVVQRKWELKLLFP